MTNRLVRCAVALAAALLPATRARAGGFEIYDQSGTATAMAGAFAAKADDPSALFYNPAGIALQPGGGAMIGATVAFTNFSNKSNVAPTVSTDTKDGIFLLPHVYLAQHLGPRFAIGVGAFPQFGAGAKWTDQGSDGTMKVAFPGRFVAQNTQVQTFTINPAIALRPIEHVGIAIGFDAMLGSVELDKSLQIGDAEAKAQLGGSARGYGMNFGVIADVIPRYLSFGFAYRSSVDLDFNKEHARVHFVAPPELRDNLYDQSASTKITMPHNFTVGLATRPCDGLTITADLHVTLWSDLKTISVTFPEGKTPSLSAPQNWNDSWSLRVGGEYLALRKKLALRLGGGFDATPVPSSTLGPSAPLSDLIVVSGGLGYTHRGFGVNAAYVAGISTGERTSDFVDYRSKYSGLLQAVSLSVSYQWGRAAD